MKREVFFERGYDCMTFECVHGSATCKPGSGGSHGRHGLNIRFVVYGEAGAVQFSLYTGWGPFRCEPSHIGSRMVPNDYTPPYHPLPADLGYHARKPQYENQTSMGPCQYLDGADCYYDGSGLNAVDAFYTLVNGGDEALWKFLESYYKHTFEDAPYPEVTEYPTKLRSKP